MLDLRPDCERCGTDLPPDADARICSFECTFCPQCAASCAEICPNCTGNLQHRPLRPPAKLRAYPADTVRRFKA